MPAATSSEPPSVPLSFSNNFWGKDDAGVAPLLERMHNAKTTCDELKAFYSARAAIEEDYAKRLLSLARKPLGSAESGTLRLSLDVVRAEIEAMGKAHQNNAAQMRSELDEPLAAFAGALKERRKIVQVGIEKLHKCKAQQTAAANKARDKYENDCLKVKGYLAQGHMVMGHEERKNKAKLEKTQIQMSSNSSEYEAAIKVLEETTGRWNREWKAACDKFQDLEEERIDFLKTSLWTFANISSTVCVSDDASCEKIRLSLEDCDVEKDIITFIKEKGTGQEIPDPPKYIDFCRGDASDAASEASMDEAYTVAQFPRPINPAIRSSSPQPSVFESHNDPSPNTALAQEMGMAAKPPPPEQDPFRRSDRSDRSVRSGHHQVYNSGRQSVRGNPYQQVNMEDVPQIPHNPYPSNGMTQFCRSTPNIPPPGERSAASSPIRPSSRDSASEYSNPSSFTSYGPSSGAASPVKQMDIPQLTPVGEDQSPRKRGFFNSPFKRSKSRHGRELAGANSETSSASATPTNPRSTWSASPAGKNVSYDTDNRDSPARYRGRGNTFTRGQEPTPEAEPVDPNAQFQLNVGNNVFDVESPDMGNSSQQQKSGNDNLEMDPIAQALEDLKGITKASSVRQTADRYAGLATPAPGASPLPGGMPTPLSNANIVGAQRGTPPPAYDVPVSRLGAPPAAHTAKAMRETTKQFTAKKDDIFNRGSGGGTWGRNQNNHIMRAASPQPIRAASPQPAVYNQQHQSPNQGRTPSHNAYNRPPSSAGLHNNARPVSPNPYGSTPPGNSGRPRANTNYGSQRGAPPARAVSPQPHFGGPASRPQSRAGGGPMAVQLASPSPQSEGGYGTQRGRPQSMYVGGGGNEVGRVRSKSVAEPGRMTTRDGIPIMHYARALYMYQAQIPEELGFAKGDVLAVLRHQDDGWWEAEVCGKEANGRGLVPSNYLQIC
ncbi:uncharacterized protein PV09_01340 [Verruconis gallopava]|uniref:F-BAR domain-containing protein n=1 Tax=Verruconis gallopava TaxID=253628 RepID=A0A0D1Z658_9PEZI|nr:uncharacterized protein PV09_01340 [Verruconis gallopava]KIW08437.1 hypothetical protein PV09_01340 [Verruconis gallopava]